MTRGLFLVGAGGHCKVVADVARAVGFELVGVVDLNPALIGQPAEPGGAVVSWHQPEFFAHIQAHGRLPEGADAVFVSVGYNDIRMRLIAQLEALSQPTLLHPGAILSPSASVGAGSVVLPGAVLNAASRVGQGVIVNTGAIIEHDCVVGDGAHLSPHATLCGGVTVGQRAWIGAGAVVIPGVTIGEGAIVGAGAVVIRAVGAGETVVGNPARVIRAASS